MSQSFSPAARNFGQSDPASGVFRAVTDVRDDGDRDTVVESVEAILESFRLVVPDDVPTRPATPKSASSARLAALPITVPAPAPTPRVDFDEMMACDRAYAPQMNWDDVPTDLAPSAAVENENAAELAAIEPHPPTMRAVTDIAPARVPQRSRRSARWMLVAFAAAIPAMATAALAARAIVFPTAPAAHAPVVSAPFTPANAAVEAPAGNMSPAAGEIEVEATATPEPRKARPFEPSSRPSPKVATIAPFPGPFSADAARRALRSRAPMAAGCAGSDDAPGTARVRVTFLPSGRATHSVIEGVRYAGTSLGGCIATAFRGLTIAPFEGEPVVVTTSVQVP
jgi:hypothetical protein